jgi:hypothetical protein
MTGRARSLRVAVVGHVIIVIFFSIAFVFLFLFLFVWLFSQAEIGRQPIRRSQVGAFRMYSAHAQWYASYPVCKRRQDNSRNLPTVLFFCVQLLREVSADAHFLDGMKLCVQEVRVPFFVLEHRLK